MFIEVDFKRLGDRYTEKPVKLNLDNVEIMEFDERKMFVKEGKVKPKGPTRNHVPYSSDKKTESGEWQMVKIVTFKKWQKNSMPAPDEYVLYFPPEKEDEYSRFRSFLD